MRLAGHIGKTLAEIDAMDSREFSQWIAFSRWFSPLSDSWSQTGLLASCVLAPHSKKPPDTNAFIPVDGNAPQHWTQIREQVRKMKADLDG